MDLSGVSTLVLDGGFIDGLHEIVLDGSLGTSGTLEANDELQLFIPASVGQHRGTNLFHSFDRFRLSAGGTAIFTAPETMTISTIIARVTGDDPALIDGTLRSDIADANLFFLSPQGIVFGSGASLEVDGAFHVSTADYLRFDDEDLFHAHLTPTSGLSDGTPVAFGFSAGALGEIRLQSARLSVGAGLPLSVVGGDITMSGGELVSAGGQVQLVSAAAGMEVGLTATGEIMPEGEVALGGRLRLVSEALVSVEDRRGEAQSGGRILLRGGEVDISNSEVKADAVSDGSAGVIDIKASDLKIRDENGEVSDDDNDDSEVTAGTQGNSNSAGGFITLIADTMTISHESTVNVGTRNAKMAGNIEVYARDLTIASEGRLQASALPNSKGAAGNVTITSDTVTVTSRGRLRSVTQGEGDAGVISIMAKQIDIDNGGRVQTSAQKGSKGKGGDIMIDASERLTVSGGRMGGGLIESFTEGPGKAGNISVYSEDLRIRSGGRISAEIRKTDGDSGNGGSVTVEAGRLFMDGGNSRIESSTADSGDAGTIVITAQEVEMRNGAFINTRTTSSGDAGKIVITSDQVGMRDRDTRISSTSSGSGDAGEITIEANLIELKNLSRIESVAEGGGNAGKITLCTVCRGELGKIELSQGSRIEVSTLKSGDGGQVQIDTGTLALLNNSEIEGRSRRGGSAGQVFVNTEDMQMTNSRIEVNNGGTSKGGLIHIQAITLDMSNDSRIDSNTEGSEQAGDVMVSARDITLSGDSRFQASALLESTGNAGTVTVTANRLTVQDMARIRSVTQGTGDAGTIRITVNELTVANKGRIQTSTQEVDSGKAGNIIIDAKRFTASQIALIESFTLGDNSAGNITIRADHMTVETGAQIRADTREGSRGAGGSVTVNADTLIVRNGGRINTETQALGAAGSVRIEVNHLNITEAGQISSLSLTDAIGAAGSVTVRGREAGTATHEVQLSRDGRIRTSVEGPGSGENAEVNINANRLTLSDFSIITSTAEVENAGQITIHGLETLEMTDSSITTDAQNGDGGNILIDTQDTIRLRNSQITATVGGGAETTGGNVTLNANVITQQRSQILAQAGQGKGGIINIMASLVVNDVDSSISASSDIPANDGEVNVQGLVADLSGSLVPLPQRFGTSDSLNRQRCAERVRGRGVSQFLLADRDRMPLNPDGVLPSPPIPTASLPGAEPDVVHLQMPELGAGMIALHTPANAWLDCR